MLHRLAKRCWKTAPEAVRLVALRLALAMRAIKRDGTTPGDGPCYVVGSLRAATGVGKGAHFYLEQCRSEGCEAIGVDVTAEMLQEAVLPSPSGPSASDRWLTLADLEDRRGPGTVVIHANPPLFQLLLARLPQTFLRNKRLVAYWAWELERLPQSYVMALPYVDAVEVPSTFTAQAVQHETTKQVTVHPHVVPMPTRQKTTFCENGILHCLYIVDLASGYERKNPRAAIAAFANAFPNGMGASLTIKVSQHLADRKAFATLCQLADATPGVRIVTGWLTPDQLEELYLQNDVYLSTHRSEGYGLTLREAMNYGLYVVATGWSGNMDFMHGTKDTALPYALVNAGQHGQWAEVDVDKTALELRRIQGLAA